jgi:glycosyltransferase involved in cell wall biosynthesis
VSDCDDDSATAPIVMTRVAKRTLFIYWGRRGSLSQIVLDLARVRDDAAMVSISRQNELYAEIEKTGAPLLPVDTFEQGYGAFLHAWRLLRIRRDLAKAVRRESIERVVVLMPHVWTPLIASTVRAAGARYVVVVHDAQAHPGDRTGWLNDWLLRDAAKADRVIALSRHVAEQLSRKIPQLKNRIEVLFHPVTEREVATSRGEQVDDVPGFLFFGRLMAYKGLGLFVEACEQLTAKGVRFRIGVAGEGELGALGPRLTKLGAEVTNRWIATEEVPTLFARYQAVVVPSVEASQSGVVAVAHGLGLPVIATPVGGMVEQVEHERTGLLAEEASANAVALAMERMIADGELRARLRCGVQEAQRTHSMRRFYEALIQS